MADVLLGNVGLGAVGRHADGGDAQLMGHLQMVDGADARQQQRRDFGLLHQRDHGREVFLVAMRREAIVDRSTTQAVAVGDFDQRHAGRIQALGDALHLLQADLVTLGVHAVAQAHVVYGDFLAAKVHGALLKARSA